MTRSRLSLDVEPDVRHRIRLAAARRDQSLRQYILESVEDRLKADLEDDVLTAEADPVLADLWDNRADADYDRL